MQRFKKFIAIFVTMVMVMATGVVGFGATPEKATVTVNLTEAAGTSGITVTAYKLMSLDKGLDYNFTVNSNNKTALQNALGLSGKTDEEIINTIKAMSNDSQEVKRLADKLSKESLSDVKQVTISNSQTSGSIADLDLGYYLISAPDNTGKKVQRALVVVDGDKEVTLKMQEILFVKKANGEDFETGENIAYTIETEVPDTESSTDYVFAIKDTLSEGIDFKTEANGNVKTSIKIKSEDGNSDVVTEENIEGTLSPDKKTMTIDLSEFIRTNSNDHKGKKLTITYNAVLNDKVDIVANNSAKLIYGKKSALSETLESKVNVYSYPLRIRKIDDSEPRVLLAGAEFKLYDNESNANTAVDNPNDPNNIKLVGSDGLYTVVSGATGENAAITLAKSLETNEYNLKINGLKAGKEYWLVETKAPDKYNKLKKPIKIVITPDKTDKTKWITLKDSQEEADNIIDVKNGKGGLLPETGGMGTIIFTIVGLGLILAALGMRKTRKEQ